MLRQRSPIPSHLEKPVLMRAFDMSAGEEYEAHRHNWAQLTYTSFGLLTVETPDGNWTVPPARAVWIPPETDHAIKSSVPAAFRSLYIRKDKAPIEADHCRVLSVSPLFREMIRAIADLPENYDEDGPAGRLYAVALDQIAEMQEETTLHLPMPRTKSARMVADSLIRDPGDTRDLEAFGKAVGASARSLGRYFSTETGLTFGEWRRRARLIFALERLTQGDPVTTVALDSGYDSPSAFIAMFKRVLGVAPGAYLSAQR